MKRVLKRIARNLFLTAEDKAYISEIKKSELFDKEYYSRNFKPYSSQRIYPLRHFVTEGESRNLSPNRQYLAPIYLANYDDLNELTEPPFRHYINHGMSEGRNAHKLNEHSTMPASVSAKFDVSHLDFPEIPHTESGVKTLVVIHIYYPEIWAEFREYLAELSEPYDLICTITDRSSHSSAQICAEIKSFKADAETYLFPNHGRDIYPFIHLINSGRLDQYDVISKIHTKKSPHRNDGAKWRNSLIEAVLPNRNNPQLFSNFRNHTGVGLIVSDGNLALDNISLWSDNVLKTYYLLSQKGGLDIDTSALTFPKGSIFLTKKPIIQELKKLQLEASDFELENGQVDGTTAHCIERAIGYLVIRKQLTLVEPSSFSSDITPHK